MLRYPRYVVLACTIIAVALFSYYIESRPADLLGSVSAGATGPPAESKAAVLDDHAKLEISELVAPQPAPQPEPAPPSPTVNPQPQTPAPPPAPKPAPKPKPKPKVQPAPSCSGSTTQQFLCLLNNYRVGKGLNKLSFDSSLAEVATTHSKWMNSTNTFSHTGSDGSRLGDRCNAAGITCRGENLAKSPQSVQHLLDMWKASPGHNAILLGNYSVMGLGISGIYVTLLVN